MSEADEFIDKLLKKVFVHTGKEKCLRGYSALGAIADFFRSTGTGIADRADVEDYNQRRRDEEEAYYEQGMRKENERILAIMKADSGSNWKTSKGILSMIQKPWDALDTRKKEGADEDNAQEDNN